MTPLSLSGTSLTESLMYTVTMIRKLLLLYHTPHGSVGKRGEGAFERERWRPLFSKSASQ